MMIKPNIYFTLLKHSLFLIAFMFICIQTKSQSANGTITIKFINTANHQPVDLRTTAYKNEFQEEYFINKLKYYVGHFFIDKTFINLPNDNYLLIDASKEANEISLKIPEGTYSGLSFNLGVDSIDNCNGAQDGALDPINDMFWTWNSGYVFFKLEGTSTASTSDLNRIEYHLGGYKDENNINTAIKINGLIHIKANKKTELIVECNLDNFWNTVSAIKISEHSVCMTAGDLAKKIAANFSSLFSLKSETIAP